MTTIGVGQVRARIVFDQLHVVDKAAADMTALDEVVAENPVGRKAVFQGVVKGLHVVDALADVLPLPEEIVVDVGDLAGVGIQARLSGKQAGEPGLLCGDQADGQPRLQDPVAAHRTAAGRVDLGAIERMGDRAHQLRRGFRRQPRIGVQRNHVFHRANRRQVSLDDRVRVAAALAHQVVEILQLPALRSGPIQIRSAGFHFRGR